MPDTQPEALVTQAFSQAAAGILPIDTLVVLLELIVNSSNYPLAGMLYKTWRENVPAGLQVSAEQYSRLSAALATLAPHVPGLPAL